MPGPRSLRKVSSIGWDFNRGDPGPYIKATLIIKNEIDLNLIYLDPTRL